MKKLLFLWMLLAAGQSFAQYGLKDLQPLHQLNGSWESTRKKGTLIEQWSIVNDSTLQGYSYLLSATDSIPQETVSLVLREGKIFYIPTTARQNDEKPVSFQLVKTESGKYFFENRQHDFPQLITYHVVDNETLHAAISGPMNGEDREIPFYFKRRSH
ncbi:MAG: DUF6265 family protein [Ferruginibacter sp.]